MTYWVWSVCFTLHDALLEHIGNATFRNNLGTTYRTRSGNYRILTQALTLGFHHSSPRKAMLTLGHPWGYPLVSQVLMFDKWERNASYPRDDPRRWMDTPLWRKVNWVPV